jgi:hypothetical protein
MYIYNKMHVLLSTLSYMFRRLLCHLQGEIFVQIRNYCHILRITEVGNF